MLLPQHANVFTITDQEETILVSLAIPAVPNAEQAETVACAEEPNPNMSVQTPPVASATAKESREARLSPLHALNKQ